MECHRVPLRFDPKRYDFRSRVSELLAWAGPKLGFGTSGEELELFQAKEAISIHFLKHFISFHVFLLEMKKQSTIII